MLRSKIIRLAHMNPELRPHLLPLLKEAARVPSDKDVLRTYPKGSTITLYHNPSFSGLEIDRMEGTEVTVLDLEPRFTTFGSQPFVMHILLQDADGNTAWVPPWKMSRAGQTPPQRVDIDVIANKLNGPLKKLGLKRHMTSQRWEREWMRPYSGHLTSEDQEKAKQALNKHKLLRRVRDGLYTLKWPTGDKAYTDYNVIVSDSVRLRREG